MRTRRAPGAAAVGRGWSNNGSIGGASMEEIAELRAECEKIADELHELNEKTDPTDKNSTVMHPEFDKQRR